MTKVSIVGVEGSGKTVLMAALGDKYQLPDEHGMFLRAKDRETFQFVLTQMNEMRAGRWPAGTQTDRMQDVNWRLFRRQEGAGPIPLGDVTLLDFAGEVYATAFGGAAPAGQGDVSAEVAQLEEYVATCDRLVVLVNIADLCNSPNRTDPTVLRTLWSSMGILDFAVEKGVRHVAIGLSQYERFRALAEECGGPVEVLRKYAPFLFSAYGHLPIFTLTAVDKTVPDQDGRQMPAPSFASRGLDKLMSWMLEGLPNTPVKSLTELSDKWHPVMEQPKNPPSEKLVSELIERAASDVYPPPEAYPPLEGARLLSPPEEAGERLPEVRHDRSGCLVMLIIGMIFSVGLLFPALFSAIGGGDPSAWNLSVALFIIFIFEMLLYRVFKKKN